MPLYDERTLMKLPDPRSTTGFPILYSFSGIILLPENTLASSIVFVRTIAKTRLLLSLALADKHTQLLNEPLHVVNVSLYDD